MEDEEGGSLTLFGSPLGRALTQSLGRNLAWRRGDGEDSDGQPCLGSASSSSVRQASCLRLREVWGCRH